MSTQPNDPAAGKGGAGKGSTGAPSRGGSNTRRRGRAGWPTEEFILLEAQHRLAGANADAAEWLASADVIARGVMRWARDAPSPEVVRWWRVVEACMLRLGVPGTPTWRSMQSPTDPTAASLSGLHDPLAARIPPASGPDGGA